MEDLPVDMKMEIFSRLPPEPLLKCKLVCKTWEKLLSHRKVGLLFLIITPPERNLHLYYGSYDEIYIKANSDSWFLQWSGLYLCAPSQQNPFDPVYICNPITTEYINLPRIKYKKGFVVSGFGYHPSNNKYKVIRIHYPDRMYSDKPITTNGSVEIYTLGSGTGWRSNGEITYAISKRGVLANGSLYWLDYEQDKIVVFDLLNEEFRLLATMPPCFDSSVRAFLRQRKASYQLKVVGGDLCLVHYEFGKDMDIWSYKNNPENGRDIDEKDGYQSRSWSLEFHIPSSLLDRINLYEPFALTKNNEVLMWVNSNGICCYDKKTESLKELVEDDPGLGYCQGIPHMNCLLSMKLLGQKKVKSRTDQHKRNKLPINS